MSSQHARAKELFLQALERPQDARNAFLAEACSHDTELRREVDSLLRFHADGESSSTGPVAAKPSALFVPGDVFAGRYRMVTRLGRGGMGDVWRADDLVLETPVALKLIRSTSAEARAAILNEVRLARRITHPGICRVFDVGEADDGVFFSMELVGGEDLATLLRRVGRLPSERVREIGRELCSALAAAHAQGVLHRDLKPANLLIDLKGAARITDFGIAIAHADSPAPTLAGTPAYMAPEQLSLGATLSERTDLYALGLVLYELLVGTAAPRSATGKFPPPSRLVPAVDRQLERVIMKALSADPADRPESALAMAESLEPEKRPQNAARSWIAGAAVAAIIGALAIGASFFYQHTSRPLTASDTIVLADFMNTTGEPVFDGTLKVALAVALEQTPFIKVFPDERVRQTLLLMKRNPGERLTAAVARELAQREGLKALLAGSIARLGSNYVLGIEAVNAETGDVMAREQVEVGAKEQVLSSLGKAAARLREKLGESLSSIQKFDVPLAAATTGSLDALRSYMLALDDGRLIPRVESIPHLKRAIELDPDFALAHALLAGIYSNTGQSMLAPPFARRAYELRDRVSERERFIISWRYQRDATQAWDKALEIAKSWAATYPREARAFNSMGLASRQLGQFDQAVRPLREALRIDPKFAAPHSNLVAVLLGLNRWDEARSVFQQAEAAQIQWLELHRWSYLLAFVEENAANMKAHLDWALATPEAVTTLHWPARTHAFGGQLEMAHNEFHRATQLAERDGLKEWAALFTLQDAESRALVGQCGTVGESVAFALGQSRDNFSLDRAGRLLALCGDGVQAMALSDELSTRFPEATLVQHVSLPVISAAVAISRGQAARALELLDPVRRYDRASVSEYWPAYLRGQAYLQLKDGAKARGEFESIIDQRGLVPDSVLFPLSYLGVGRAARLTGDVVRARATYERFLHFWKAGDSDLQPLNDARRELARLQSARPDAESLNLPLVREQVPATAQ